MYFLNVEQVYESSVILSRECCKNRDLFLKMQYIHTREHVLYWPLWMWMCVCVFRAGTEIVSRAARDRVRHYLDSLKQYFAGLTFSLTCLYFVHLFVICFNVYWIDSALTLLAGHLEQHPACKNWAMRHWHSYPSEARYRLFAYGSPDAIALR